MSDEAKMSAKAMGQNFIDNINILFEKWVPVEKFSIEPISEAKSKYNKHSVQYTPEFKNKLKEVLK